MSGCLAFVRKACQVIFQESDRGDLLIEGIDLSDFGVSGPCDGLCIDVDFDLLTRARADLESLATTKPFRKAADFCRPWELCAALHSAARVQQSKRVINPTPLITQFSTLATLCCRIQDLHTRRASKSKSP